MSFDPNSVPPPLIHFVMSNHELVEDRQRRISKQAEPENSHWVQEPLIGNSKE